MEMHLHRDDLVKMIEFIDRVNPMDAHLRIASGTVKVTYDNSSGIGATIKATCPHEYAPTQWGDLTITISDVENW